MNILLEPLTHAFMIRALLAASFVGVLCALVGTFIVLRGMAFFGDALSHTILPGVAIGYLVGGGERGPLFWWAMLTAVISAVGIGAISRSARIKEDTAIGIIFAGMFALGIAMISGASTRNYTVDLTHFLFGDVLAVGPNDLLMLGLFGGLVVLLMAAFFKEFVIISFDPTLALTLRLPARLLESLLLVLIAVTIVVSLQTVGVALMVAMLVTPAATAYLLTRKLSTMMGLAALIGALSGIIGLYLSFYIRVASGAAIVLVATAVFGVVFLLVPRKKSLKG